MDNEVSKMEQILSILKEKHKLVDNLMTLTKEMEKVIDREDFESLSAVLSMRQDSMDRIDKLIGSMEPLLNEETRTLLEPAEGPLSHYGPLETNIFETNRMTRALLKKVIELDEAINKKVQQSAAPV